MLEASGGCCKSRTQEPPNCTTALVFFGPPHQRSCCYQRSMQHALGQVCKHQLVFFAPAPAKLLLSTVACSGSGLQAPTCFFGPRTSEAVVVNSSMLRVRSASTKLFFLPPHQRSCCYQRQHALGQVCMFRCVLAPHQCSWWEHVLLRACCMLLVASALLLCSVHCCCSHLYLISWCSAMSSCPALSTIMLHH